MAVAPRETTRPRLGGSSALYAGKGLERLFVCIGERVQVFLGCLDLAVAQSIHDRLEIGPTCEQPGRMRVP